jgi:glucose-6-phosphate-specific signal transduction histidine kinase
MSEASSPIHFKVTPKKIVTILIANTLIAFFIVVMAPDAQFVVSFIYSQCIGISIATFSITTTNLFQKAKLPLHLLFITASVIIGAVIGIEIGVAAVKLAFPGLAAALPPDRNYAVYRSNLVIALLFGAIISYVFISLQKLSDEKIKRLEVEKNAAVTEIKLLQSQMEPHFLFNTLSNIIGLIDYDPEKARRMLESFTAFLRSSFMTARNETITLAQEMDVVRNYLDVFTVRMGARLRYTIDIPAGLEGFRVPPLLVQPLVENAVKHGLEPSISGGELLITGTREGDAVRIIVADSGLGINELSPGNGIGLGNIRKRLDLLYGGRARLVFEENKPTGVKAVIEVPYGTSTSHHS